jgi:cellulose synthase/poly-beta-1,6-N-acetylglucosamine synthase-like glycosyltransferase
MFELIFLTVVCLYFIQTVVFIVGAQKKFNKLQEDKFPSITIIVAARNEEVNIPRCLQALDKLEYPDDKLEIIIVDDRSTDKTGEIIDNFIVDKSKFRKIITKSERGRLKGKTNAIANAIDIAKGEIILTTDADCAVSPTWAKTIASYYGKDVAIVNGFTYQQAYNNFSGMQNLDFIYLLTVAAGTINFNLPLSCIGNNMSFRKSVYNEVGGYEKLPFSVTEDFNLLFAIYNLKKYKIIYPLDNGSLVESIPCKDLRELYRQKKRWGVGGLKSPLRGFLVMTTGFLTHLGILLSPFFFSSSVLYLIVFKVILDFFFLYFILNKMNLSSTIKYFPAFELYYLFYVIALPFIVIPNQKVKWKGREY